jgi:hypothetical protein
VDDKTVKVATIDTMITFYLAMYYTSKDKDVKARIFCLAAQLFELTQKRLEEDGILKRFSPTCIGDQKTLISMREEKTSKREELKNKRGTDEYESWFLNYNPGATKRNGRRRARTPPGRTSQKPRARKGKLRGKLQEKLYPQKINQRSK